MFCQFGHVMNCGSLAQKYAHTTTKPTTTPVRRPRAAVRSATAKAFPAPTCTFGRSRSASPTAVDHPRSTRRWSTKWYVRARVSAAGDSLRFAVDTGGTFTDLVVEGDPRGLRFHKRPTTPDDPVVGLLDVLAAAAE